MTILLAYVLPVVGGLALAALAAWWVARKTTRTDGASGAHPLLAFYDLHRRASQSGDATTTHAAQSAEALAAAAKLLPTPGIAGTVRTWLASPNLEHPRRLLAHHGTDEAYDHVRTLAALVDHSQRAQITQLVMDALDRAEAPRKTPH